MAAGEGNRVYYCLMLNGKIKPETAAKTQRSAWLSLPYSREIAEQRGYEAVRVRLSEVRVSFKSLPLATARRRI